MRMVRSSVPGATDRDRAIRLLTERAVLTRMICRELKEGDVLGHDLRPQTALFILLRWISDNLPESVRVEPRADDGIDQMIVPDGYAELLTEIISGAQVGKALFMLLTADNRIQEQSDRENLKRAVAAYWAEHRVTIPVVR
jgi:hypothetical protein